MGDFELSDDPIREHSFAFADEEGALARFIGAVRGIEEGRPIRGIEYSAYLPMAETELAALVREGDARGIPHRVEIQHRLGFVEAGQPSIRIDVAAKHSAEAFDLCRWYLGRVKSRVPIWKKPVP
jgi:molybdopterin synthase catalytic subunit